MQTFPPQHHISAWMLGVRQVVSSRWRAGSLTRALRSAAAPGRAPTPQGSTRTPSRLAPKQGSPSGRRKRPHLVGRLPSKLNLTQLDPLALGARTPSDLPEAPPLTHRGSGSVGSAVGKEMPW